jgi:hypothetical protein
LFFISSPNGEAGRGPLFLHTSQIATIAAINLDCLAFLDEERHTNLSTSLNTSGLQGVGSSIALQSGLCPYDLQMYLNGNVGIEHGLGACVNDNFHVLALLEELHAVHLVGSNGNLFIGLVVHEYQVVTILVEILAGTTLNAYVLEALANVETLLDNAAVYDVLQGYVHDGVALTWFAMKEVDAEIKLAVHADASALLDVL